MRRLATHGWAVPVYSVTNSSTITISAGTGLCISYVDASGALAAGHNLTLTCAGVCGAVSGVTAVPGGIDSALHVDGDERSLGHERRQRQACVPEHAKSQEAAPGLRPWTPGRKPWSQWIPRRYRPT